MQILKKYFTKSERRFVRRLQENHIPFKSKIKINGREVDFLIGKYAIDIDGHKQASDKNEMLVESGYIPIHIDNQSVSKINISYLK
jgi:hypothetical protein